MDCSLVICSPWGRTELDTTERLRFHFSLSCIREGNGSPLQCSCLENPRYRGAWWAAVYGAAQSRTWLKWLSSSSSSKIVCFCFTFLFVFFQFWIDFSKNTEKPKDRLGAVRLGFEYAWIWGPNMRTSTRKIKGMSTLLERTVHARSTWIYLEMLMW